MQLQLILSIYNWCSYNWSYQYITGAVTTYYQYITGAVTTSYQYITGAVTTDPIDI